MVAAPGKFLVAGKTLKEACAARTVERDCSCLVRFSTNFLCRIWTNLVRELKLEGLSALFSYF